MSWIYILIIIVIIVISFLITKNKGTNPKHNASLSDEEKEILEEDYLSHGGHDEQENGKNI